MAQITKFHPCNAKPECSCGTVVLRISDSRYVTGDSPFIKARIIRVSALNTSTRRGWNYTYSYDDTQLNPDYIEEFTSCQIVETCCASCVEEYLLSAIDAIDPCEGINTVVALPLECALPAI